MTASATRTGVVHLAERAPQLAGAEMVAALVPPPQFAALLGSKGIARDTTVVIYGDKNNWWAAYALWVFTLFGHDDVRLLDGGRDKWIAEGRPITTDAPAVTPTGAPRRFVVDR